MSVAAAKRRKSSPAPTSVPAAVQSRRDRLRVALTSGPSGDTPWQNLAGEVGATDGIIISQACAVLGPTGTCHTDDGPLCWITHRIHQIINVWLDEETPPKRLPDIDTRDVVPDIRQIWGIVLPQDLRRQPASVAPKAKKPPADDGYSDPQGDLLDTNAPADRRPETLDIPVGLIDRFPLNPRDELEFDEESLRKLGETIKVRQVQACVVRHSPHDRDRYELIAGERRWRAAKLLKLPTLRCELVPCTDAEAVWMCGTENEKRKDWSAIAQAKWYRELKKAEGLTDQQLAARVGVSQSHVTTVMGLLELPEDFQRRVITREITPTIARHLIPFSRKRPQVIAKVAALLRLPGSGAKDVRKEDDDPITTRVMEDAIRDAIRACTRSMSPSEYTQGAPKFRIDAKAKDVLDCEKLKVYSWDNPVVRAWNTEEWDRRQAEATKKKKEKARAEKTSGVGQAPNSRMYQYVETYKIIGWLANWQSRLFAARMGEINDKATREKLAYFLFARYFDSVIAGLAGKPLKSSRDDYLANAWGTLLGSADRDVASAILRQVKAAIENSDPHQRNGLDDGRAWCAIGQLVGIDWAAEFRPDAELLEAWPLADLQKFPGAPKGVTDKGEVIAHLVEHWKAGWLPKEVRTRLGLPNKG